MARHDTEITRTAERQLAALPRDAQRRVVRAMLALAEEPYPRGSRKLVGYDDVYRIRTGHYRVLYSVEKEVLIVIVLKIGHRWAIYRGR